MSTVYTPLRYPGGKAKLGPFLAEICKANKLTDASYAEPYAGGAGAALYLLFRGYVREIRLNDIDKGIVAFWQAVLEQNDRFVKEIENVPLNVDEWDRQKAIYRSNDSGFELGFSFFYLNRTNRSGIMNGGMIGGRSQSGVWRLDARFNRQQLVERVRSIGRMRRYITISQLDALDFLDELSVNRSVNNFVYLDPPYFSKGRDLYTNFYKSEDHARIAERLGKFSLPWLLTYDDCHEIRHLYKENVVMESELSYSARTVRRGRELVVLSPYLRLPKKVMEHQGSNSGFKLLAAS